MSSTKDTISGHMVGQRDYSSIDPAVTVDKRTDLEPFVLEGLDVHVGLFEVGMRESLAILPPSLQPTIPASLSVAFYRANDSSFGSVRLMTIGLGCRCGVKPHNLTLRSYCTNDQLAEVLTRDYGVNFSQADDVILDSGFHEVSSQVIAGGETLLHMTSEKHMTLPGASAILKYPSPLNFVNYDGIKRFLRLDLGYEFKDSSRGKVNLKTWSPGLADSLQITPQNPISATFSREVTLGVIQPKYVYDLAKTPSAGGITKIAEM